MKLHGNPPMGAALIHDRQTDSQWGGQVKTEGVSRNYENAPKTVLKVLLCTNSANSDTGAGRAVGKYSHASFSDGDTF